MYYGYIQKTAKTGRIMSQRGPSQSVDLQTPTGSESSEFNVVISIKKWFTDISTDGIEHYSE